MVSILRFAFFFIATAAFAAPPVIDFTGGRDLQGWATTHDIASATPSPEGIVVKASGGDPFLHGPRGDYSSANPLLFVASLKSESAGWGQVFATDTIDREESSVQFRVEPGWNEIAIALPPMGKSARLRFDPVGDCTIARIGVVESGTLGVASVAVDGAQIRMSLAGLAGAVEIVELSEIQSLTDAAKAPIVWKGDAKDAVVIPRIDGAHDRSASAFVAMISHPVRGRIPAGGLRFAGKITGLASDMRPFPDPGSKKGLQVQIVEDAIAIGVKHATLNVSLGALIDLDKKPGNPTWTLDGETYAFSRRYLDSLNVKRLTDAGMNVYLIILAYQTGRPEMNAAILHPARDPKMPNGIAAFNTATPAGERLWRATMEFLAAWFSGENGEHGRVVGYIIGNEVNVHWQWHSLGRIPRNAAVAQYLTQMRLANTAIRKSSASARVYMSLTHFWTIDPDKDKWLSMPGRYYIEEFARQARAAGDFDWHLAHHPYPENLGNPRTWEDKTAPQSPDAKRITFKNLEQLAAFFQRPELLNGGSPRSIILSEQGFHSKEGETGDRDQAAGYCYAWEKIARIPGIHAFVLHRHVDHQYEGGLRLGLWRRKQDSIATPDTPRPMYECFKAAGTPAQEAAFRFALPVIGVSKWDDIMAPLGH